MTNPNIKWWCTGSAAKTFWLVAESHVEGENTLEFWHWRREQPGAVYRLTFSPGAPATGIGEAVADKVGEPPADI